MAYYPTVTGRKQLSLWRLLKPFSLAMFKEHWLLVDEQGLDFEGCSLVNTPNGFKMIKGGQDYGPGTFLNNGNPI